MDADVYDTSTSGKKELLKIFPDSEAFDTPKPKKLYLELLKLVISPKVENPIILDFFAGSGTTGHAVMEYNKQHNKHLTYILATNNQNNICRDVTYERIKRVVQQEKYSESLKYYRIDYIIQKDENGNPLSFYDYAPELLEHVRELVELENGVNFTNNAENVIVLTDDEADAFFEKSHAVNSCKRFYIGHDVLLTAEQEEKLMSLEIDLNIIPDYYYKGIEG